MCFLCIELAKENMTPKEIARAYQELIIEEDHLPDVISKVYLHSNMDEVSAELEVLERTYKYE